MVEIGGSDDLALKSKFPLFCSYLALIEIGSCVINIVPYTYLHFDLKKADNLLATLNSYLITYLCE